MNTDEHIDTLVERMVTLGMDVKAMSGSAWIKDVESRLGMKLPASCRSLVTRYTFPVLELETVDVFANRGDGADDDITKAMFVDPYMSPWLISRQLIQIGRPSTGSYDPVCLDVGSAKGREPTVVQLDHEGILLERKKVKRSVIAPSFLSLLEAATDA